MILELLIALSIHSSGYRLLTGADGPARPPQWVQVLLDRADVYLRAGVLHAQGGGLWDGGPAQSLVPPRGQAPPRGRTPATSYPRDYDRDPLRVAKNSAILWRIYSLESSSGKRDSCLARGGVNGFGWNSNKTCFPDFPTAVATVGRRISDLLAAYPLRQALCIYNTGQPKGGECCYAYSYLGTRPGSGSVLTC